MQQSELNEVIRLHGMWLRGEGGGKRVDLRHANMIGANLRGADLRGGFLRGAILRNANLRGADLRGAFLRGAIERNADLRGANLTDANLTDAVLTGAVMIDANLTDAALAGANLSHADMRGANLTGANLICTGNMLEIRTMQIGEWMIGYTADALQIGCQRHPISKWRKWNTDAGRKWIDRMDHDALGWADRNLDLILQIIDANPATPTGHEKGDDT